MCPADMSGGVGAGAGLGFGAGAGVGVGLGFGAGAGVGAGAGAGAGFSAHAANTVPPTRIMAIMVVNIIRFIIMYPPYL